jgi:serine/threonine protein kinase
MGFLMTKTNWNEKTLNGRYAIERLLGQGGMSAVYKAYDPNLRLPVAIKIIRHHLSANPQFVRRFEEEAAFVAQLRHHRRPADMLLLFLRLSGLSLQSRTYLKH